MQKKILVCDDDEGILEIIQIMLENSGYEVKALSNGKAIEKKVKEYNPDLIFLDIWMPGIDGKEVTTLLKKDPETQKIPIIIISALNDTESIAKKIKADGFLNKPFNMDELLRLAEKHTN